MRTVHRLLYAGSLALALAACAGDPVAQQGPVIELRLATDTLRLRIGRAVQLSPLLLVDGVPQSASHVQYSVADTTVARILNDWVTAVGSGSTRIVGRQDDAVDTVSVVVAPRQPIALRFAVDSLAIAIGQQVDLKPLITLLDFDSTVIPQQEYACSFQLTGPALQVTTGILSAASSGRDVLRAQCLGFSGNLPVIGYRAFAGTVSVYRFNDGTGNPYPVDVHGDYAVVGRPGLGTIQRINLLTGATESPIQVDSSPVDIAIDPSGTTAYVATSAGQSVAIVDLVSGTVTARYPVPAAGGAPNRIRLVGSRLVVATFGGLLHVLDAATGVLDTSYAVVWFGPQDIWVNGTQVTVIEENRAATVIDVAAHQLLRTLTFPHAGYTYGIAYLGDTVFANSTNGIEVDVPGRQGVQIVGNLFGSDIEIAAGGQLLYTSGRYANAEQGVNVIDWKANYLVTRYLLGNTYWYATLRQRPDGMIILSGAEGILVVRPQ